MKARDIGAGLIVAALVAHVRIRSQSPDLIASVGAGYGSLVTAALGRPSRPFRRCWAWCHYPTSDGWTTLYCPLEYGHGGLHADDTLYPFWSDDDAAWFAIHYRLCTLEP